VCIGTLIHACLPVYLSLFCLASFEVLTWNITCGWSIFVLVWSEPAKENLKIYCHTCVILTIVIFSANFCTVLAKVWTLQTVRCLDSWFRIFSTFACVAMLLMMMAVGGVDDGKLLHKSHSLSDDVCNNVTISGVVVGGNYQPYILACQKFFSCLKISLEKASARGEFSPWNSENLAALSRVKLYLSTSWGAVSLCRVYCVNKFQIIFLHMHYENLKWKSLMLFNTNFTVGNLWLSVGNSCPSMMLLLTILSLL